jgi:RNA polymerase sigma-70 factor (ECF subfamily)
VTRRLIGYAARQQHAEGADERAEWSEALEATLAALSTLGARDREVLLLHAWEGLQGEDLAAALGCSTGAAAARLHRARRRLRAAQAHRDGAEPHPLTEQTGVTT